jgi:signal transduction histidine kinase
VEISRQAGMAEVATGVLHNVGTVLNSVNVSAGLVLERLRRSKVTGLTKLADLLTEHAGGLGEFLTSDARGRQVPGYVAALARHLGEEHAFFVNELEGLGQHIDHVKAIVAVQQASAGARGVADVVSPAQLVEDALHLNASVLAGHQVRVLREYRGPPAMVVDRHKVLQILVNLIQNADYSMLGRPAEGRFLEIRIDEAPGDRVRIRVSDQGTGIAPQDLTRIFQHGFTTRKDGHGFGLHSGALTARELDGSLTAFSDGTGTGATFTLELPRNPAPTPGAVEPSVVEAGDVVGAVA